MIIGIDATAISKKQKTGVEKTASQIIYNLLSFDKNNHYLLFCQTHLPKEYKKFKNIEEIRIPYKIFWHKVHLPLKLLKIKPDIFVSPSNEIPNFAPKKNIAFVYDLAFKYFPNAYSRSQLLILNSALKTISRRAQMIVFPSNNSKKDFQKFYPKSKAKKYILPLGVDKNIFKVTKEGNDFLNIKSKYFLYLGRLESRKNITNLVRAYKLFCDKEKTKIKLVLAGAKGHGFSDIDLEIYKLLKNRCQIIMPGFIDDKYLPQLYSQAEAFIFPSLYEGFGLPILEAMSCGVPVIASNCSSLGEVAGDAVYYVDPKKPEEIAMAMKMITSDKKLRIKLIKDGFERVKKFSWQKTAEELYKIIKKFN